MVKWCFNYESGDYTALNISVKNLNLILKTIFPFLNH